MVDAKLRGQLAAAPVRGAIGGFAMERPIEDARLNPLATRLGLATTMAAKESGHALRQKPIPPRHTVFTLHCSARLTTQTVSAGSQAQQNVRPPRVLSARATTAAQTLEFPALRRTKNNAICHATTAQKYIKVKLEHLVGNSCGHKAPLFFGLLSLGYKKRNLWEARGLLRIEGSSFMSVSLSCARPYGAGLTSSRRARSRALR